MKEREIDFFFLGTIDGYKPFREKIFKQFPKIENKKTRLIDVGEVLKLQECSFNLSLSDSKEQFERCHMKRTNMFFEWSTNSKFSLMTRGHDFQSERLFSSMSSATINLIFSDFLFETGVPFQCFVPWKEFVFQIDSNRFFEDPLSSLSEVISLDDKKLSEIQKKIIEYRRDVLWDHPESRVAENILKDTVIKYFSNRLLDKKNLHHYKNYKCKFKDVQDDFGDKILLHEHIH